MIRPDSDRDLREIPVSTLAYIGDAVYELYVRLHMYRVCRGPSGDLHGRCIRKVAAGAQSVAVQRLLPLLDDDEKAVYRRARNQDPSSRPRHADPIAYASATGLEAVVGYLYLKADDDRLDLLMRQILTAEALDDG